MPEVLNIQPPDPGALAEQVVRVLVADVSRQERIQQLLQLTVGLVNGVGVIFYQEQDGVLQSAGQLLSRQAESMAVDIIVECKESAARDISNKKASVLSLSHMESVHVISCPVAGVKDVAQSCLSVLVVLGNSPREPFLIIIQLMAVVLSRIQDTRMILSASLNSSKELLSFIARNGKISDLRTFSADLRQWFGCSVLAIGSGQQYSGKIRLKSVTDVVKVDAKTSQSRLFIKVMQDCVQQNSTIAWPALHTDPASEESLLVKELVLANGMRQGGAVVLPGLSGKATVFVFLWSEEGARAEQIAEFVRAAPLLGLMLQTLGSADFAQPLDSMKTRTTVRKWLVLAVLAMIFGGFVLYPAKFKLNPDCYVFPVQIHYVVAHFDGLLQKVFVEPGDRVSQNSQLAVLDGRELELELRSIRADSGKALKLRDNHLATGNVAAAQIGLLEYERLQERAKLLLIRQQQLSMESPAAGIVLSGDLKRAEGGPVTKGQVLFEVAPLEKILIEMAVADADISYVQEQAPVTVRFDAFPSRKWQGKVDRISPKSALIQGQNAFVVSFKIVNSGNFLKPGMQGRASIECGEKNLLWIYFHKPWYALVSLFHSIF